MFKYLRFLGWIVVTELLPAIRKAIAKHPKQSSETGRKDRIKKTPVPSVDTEGEN